MKRLPSGWKSASRWKSSSQKLSGADWLIAGENRYSTRDPAVEVPQGVAEV
jgi:hypothetical protein